MHAFESREGENHGVSRIPLDKPTFLYCWLIAGDSATAEAADRSLGNDGTLPLPRESQHHKMSISY